MRHFDRDRAGKYGASEVMLTTASLRARQGMSFLAANRRSLRLEAREAGLDEPTTRQSPPRCDKAAARIANLVAEASAARRRVH